MLDPRLLHHDADQLLAALQRRGLPAAEVETLRQLAATRRQAIGHTEALRRQLNEASAAMGKRLQQAQGDGAPPSREALKALKGELKESEARLQAAEAALQTLLLRLPNLPAASVPEGTDEAANVTVGTWGEPTAMDFAPRPHFELGEALGIINFAQAGRVSGARFAFTHGAGARLARARAAYMLDLAREHGYQEVAPPLLVQPQAMQAAGQYPKFIGEAFATQNDPLVLIPTAEVPLVAMHGDSILDEADLPLRYCAYTACFRREAGAAGRDTRGLIRQHQFTKVELVTFATPDHSAAEHERLTGHAEAVLRGLKLPYRKVELCSGDLGFAACKTYDLEVWLPASQAYREISSCSNCGDFQARRGAIRYRPTRPAGASKPGKPQLLHTLNGSALAVGRTFVAVLENYQRADGSIEVPAALRPYFGAEHIAGA